MDNPQLYEVYVSCDCKGKLYIGHTKKTNDLLYFGSYTDKTFKPCHRFALNFSEIKPISLLIEWGYQNCFNSTLNERFANRATNFMGNIRFLKEKLSEEHKKAISKGVLESKKYKEGIKNRDNLYLKTKERREKSRQQMLIKNPMNNPKSRKKCSQKGEKNGMYGRRFNPELSKLRSHLSQVTRKINILNKWIKEGIEPSKKCKKSCKASNQVQALHEVHRLSFLRVGLKSQIENFGSNALLDDDIVKS